MCMSFLNMTQSPIFTRYNLLTPPFTACQAIFALHAGQSSEHCNILKYMSDFYGPVFKYSFISSAYAYSFDYHGFARRTATATSPPQKACNSHKKRILRIHKKAHVVSMGFVVGYFYPCVTAGLTLCSADTAPIPNAHLCPRCGA